jgi:hypothetical protein
MRKKLILLAALTVFVGLIYLLYGPNLFVMLMIPILWFAGRGIVARSRAAREPFLRTAARLLIAIFASLGCLIAIKAEVLVGKLGLPEPLAEAILGSFIAFSGLFVYWLEDAFALVMPGLGRTILRALVSLILASFAAMGFWLAVAIAYVPYFLDHGGPNYFEWMAWALVFLGFAGSFYVTWKQLLSERPSEVSG